VSNKDEKGVAKVEQQRETRSSKEQAKALHGKVDKRLPGKGISNSHGARPVNQIISMIEWIWTESS
jgi:hypothetical protein